MPLERVETHIYLLILEILMQRLYLIGILGLTGIAMMWMAQLTSQPENTAQTQGLLISSDALAKVCHCDPRTIGPGGEPDDIRLCEKRCHKHKAPACPEYCETYQQDVADVRNFYPPAVVVN